jgi:hypothetical protein
MREKMKNIMIIAGASVLVGMMSGCATCSKDKLACKHEKLVTTETYVWSSDQVSRTVYPDVQGPVDTYRPTYKVDEKKYTIKGVGDTDKQAVANAIYNMCKAKNCDYMVTAKCYITKTVDRVNGTSFEAELVGFPVYITGVETIKPKFYEQQKDGTLKQTDMEHKVIFTTDNKWVVAEIPGAKGAVDTANSPAVVSRTERKVRMCEIENGVPPPLGDSGVKPLR